MRGRASRSSRPRGLLTKHYKELRASAISDAAMKACGIRSLRRDELLEIGFAPRQALPGWACPISTVPGGEISHWFLKPDKPRRDSRGKTVKYENPHGRTARLFVHA